MPEPHAAPWAHVVVRSRSWLRTLTAGLLLALALCAVCPLTLAPVSHAAGLFGSFGIKDEQELGRKFAVLVRSRLPLIEDPEVKLYVQSIVDRLDKAIPPQPFPFDASVLLHHTMNAFAVPGGYVFVHTGLIMELEHEAELAGVLAHELAHVTQRHVASRIERSKVVTAGSLLGALAGAFLGGGQATGAMVSGSLAAGQAAMLNYSRMDETDADQVGLQYLVKAGYNPQGLSSSFEKIRRKQWATGMDIPEYLSTHPDVTGRITEVTARLKSLPPAVLKRPDKDDRFLRVKALVWARYGDTDQAMRIFSSASPKDAVAQMGLGILLARRNRMPEADAAFTRALALNPKDALIWREAGRFYYSKGDSRAADALQRALTLDPRDTMAQFFFARMLDGSNRRTEAHNYYEEVLRSVPEDIEVHFVFGRSLGEAGKTFDAYLHLTYSAVYGNDAKKTRTWYRQTKAAARSPQDTAALERLEGIIRERSAFWNTKDIL